jgi:hypothetical protein
MVNIPMTKRSRHGHVENWLPKVESERYMVRSEILQSPGVVYSDETVSRFARLSPRPGTSEFIGQRLHGTRFPRGYRTSQPFERSQEVR